MLQIRSIHRLDQIEIGLRQAAARHGGSVLSIAQMGEVLRGKHPATTADAITFTLCLPDLYEPLLSEDIRFAAFLPVRIAACARHDTLTLEAISPREFCRILHRPELEPVAVRLEDALRGIMEEASRLLARAAEAGVGVAEHRATEDQVNMRAALPQRIDCHGSKVEELAGTGALDTQGG